MDTIVISGINLFEGGPLTVYYSFLNSLIDLKIYNQFKIIIFVHKRELFETYTKKVEIIELPKSRKNYIFRLWYEYIFFYFFSIKVKPKIWISLHDITPNVKAEKLFTYCHNPSPFYKMNANEICNGFRIFLFTKFYKYLYRINITHNTGIIVQQEWIRKEFLRLYPISNIIVARPYNKFSSTTKITKKCNLKFTFIFPSFPRVFKNFEVICDACDLLEKNTDNHFQVLLTLDGSENKYAKRLKNKYAKTKSVKWIGLQTTENLMQLYVQVDAMIFPSKLETWGLPISEFKETEKPMLLADLPYSHETLGKYKNVSFFNPCNSKELADKMYSLINGELKYQGCEEMESKPPIAHNWDELVSMIINKD